MHARLIALVLPLILAVGAILGGLLFVESARRVTAEAQHEAATDFALTLQRLDQVATDPDPDLVIDNDLDGVIERAIAPAITEHRWISVATANGTITTAGTATVERIADQSPQVAQDQTIWPWTEGATTYAGSVDTDDGRLTLEFVERSQPVKAAVSRQWLVIAAVLATVSAAVAAAAYPLSRFALKPVAELNATARALASGDFNARAHVGRGAPELHELAESVNQMAETVASGVQRERSFVSSASHHFGNLLTPLRLRIETLDRTDHQVEEALAELDRLETTAERLLLLNRTEEGDVQPIVQDIAHAVDETIRSWEVVTDLKGIELVRGGSALATAWAVPGAIEEVLDNLIDNSVKYGERTRITVSVLRGLHNVRVVVSDRGPGMSDHEIEHAMGRFWRGSTQQGKPGSGLGLAIADALATRCGGRLEVRTSSNGGLESSLVLERAS